MQAEFEKDACDWEKELLQFLKTCITNPTVTVKDFLVSTLILL